MADVTGPTLEALDDKALILQIYQKYKRLMFGTAKKYAESPQDCEDIVQESILRLIERVDCFRRLDRGRLPAYIASTVRNTAINHLKHQAVIQRHSAPPEEQPPGDAPAFSDLARLLHQREQLSLIWASLSEEDRFLLEGKYMIGLTDLELAGQLGCAAGSVRMKLTRARRGAIRLLTQREEDGLDE